MMSEKVIGKHVAGSGLGPVSNTVPEYTSRVLQNSCEISNDVSQFSNQSHLVHSRSFPHYHHSQKQKLPVAVPVACFLDSHSALTSPIEQDALIQSFCLLQVRQLFHDAVFCHQVVILHGPA
jgi:hypothetical protein